MLSPHSAEIIEAPLIQGHPAGNPGLWEQWWDLEKEVPKASVEDGGGARNRGEQPGLEGTMCSEATGWDKECLGWEGPGGGRGPWWGVAWDGCGLVGMA